MRRCLIVILLLFASDITLAQTTRPIPEIRKALLISVDGGRPDLLLRADAPNIRALYQRGTFTFWARSTPQSITLPTHVSMLTGVRPEAHAILWNGDLPLKEPVYPRVPTLFELAKQNGYSTAMVASKTKFNVLNKPGTIDWIATSNPTKESDDSDTIEQAVAILKIHKPDVMFVHFADADVAGHAKGWGTKEQLDAIGRVDGYIGRLLSTLGELKLDDQTMILLTADHGGAGRAHGPEDSRSRTIPWIIAGPGIRQNYDLSSQPDLDIDIYDSFATTCKLLAIPLKRPVQGKFVSSILQQQELLKTTER